MKVIKNDMLSAEAKYLKVLVYGMPGAGKTWFCASAALDPRSKPVLYVEYRGQSVSLAGFQGMEAGSFVHLRLETFRDINTIYTYVFNKPGKVPELDALFPDGRPKTLVIDSITELQRLEVLRHGEIDAGERAGKNLQIPDNLVNPSPYNWGKLLNQFMIFGNKHYELPMNVIITALEKKEFKSLGIGKPPELDSVGIALQGQAAEIFPSTALTVMRLQQVPAGMKTKAGDPVYNRATFHQTGKAYGRDHTNAFTKPMYNPTVGRMLDLLGV